MSALTKCYKAKIEDLTNEGSYIARIAVFGDKNNVDKDGDFFKSDAFDKTIKKRKGIFPGVWMHDARRPVALGEVEKDSKGLIVTAQINLDTKDGQETHSNMKKGIAGDHSIAFNPNMKKADRLVTEEGRVTGFGFGESELLEFSPLTIGFAANDNANLIALKWRNGAEYKDMTFDEMITELMASHGDEFALKYQEIIDSVSPEEVDSLDEAKEMWDIMSRIKGIISNLDEFCEGR